MKKNTVRQNNWGFTLIEVMVAVSIISLISSLVVTSLNVARAKGNDAATISQVHQIQNAFFIETITNANDLPNPGSAATYYCLGKSGVQTCNFWGFTGPGALHGNNIVKASLVSGGLVGEPSSRPVVIGGLLYDAYLYKCRSITVLPEGSVCTGAIYWAQSSHTACTIGVEVFSGVGGRVCGQDAGAETVNNIDMGCPPRPLGGLTC
ncbi:MAG: type II secretion system protein [bacterium]|nr:type II secretion system protein [bacterium]